MLLLVRRVSLLVRRARHGLASVAAVKTIPSVPSMPSLVAVGLMGLPLAASSLSVASPGVLILLILMAVGADNVVPYII